jgi:hypothetical protein
MRRWALSAAVWLTLLLIACVHQLAPVSHGARNLTLRSLVLHADTDFGPGERERIAEAINALNEGSAGAVEVNAVYDLDFYDTSSIVAHAQDDLLVRAPTDAPYVVHEDGPDGMLLGVTAGLDLDRYDPSVQKRVYLVADRLWSRDVFVHVTEHEVMHALGARHVDDLNAVMFRSVVGTHPTTCLTWSDATELCRAVGCKAQTTNWCK